MKRAMLRKFSATLKQVLEAKNISPKELAKMSKIGYSSLIPILNGTRDFGITKLVAIANALHCSTDLLLSGTLSVQCDPSDFQLGYVGLSPPRYLVVFISRISITYCTIFEVESRSSVTSVLNFSLGCGQSPDDFLDHIVMAIQDILSKSRQENITYKDIAVFTSVQQYEWAANRAKIQKNGNNLFSKFIVESDAITNYKALLGNKNGICITINDGNSITYSVDDGKTIVKLQGYGFPISDVAGNLWVGCEAIKYVIDVKEHLEPSSLLSDRILALFHDDLAILSESIMLNPEVTYFKASAAIREIIGEDKKSQEIVKKSFTMLCERVKLIDDKVQIKLPIVLAGDLANVYKPFFPRDRIINSEVQQSSLLLDYGIKRLKEPSEI